MPRPRNEPDSSPVRAIRVLGICYGCGAPQDANGLCAPCGARHHKTMLHQLAALRARPKAQRSAQETEQQLADRIHAEERALWTDRTRAARKALDLPTDDTVPYAPR